MIESEVTIERSSAKTVSISGTGSYPFITVTSDSVITITEFNYTDNTAPFLHLLSSLFTGDSLILKNIVCDDYMLKIDQG